MITNAAAQMNLRLALRSHFATSIPHAVFEHADGSLRCEAPECVDEKGKARPLTKEEADAIRVKRASEARAALDSIGETMRALAEEEILHFVSQEHFDMFDASDFAAGEAKSGDEPKKGKKAKEKPAE